jgi:hypothetical protein
MDEVAQWGALYFVVTQPQMSRQMKLMRMRSMGNVVRKGEVRKVYKVLVGSRKERDHSEEWDQNGS